MTRAAFPWHRLLTVGLFIAWISTGPSMATGQTGKAVVLKAEGQAHCVDKEGKPIELVKGLTISENTTVTTGTNTTVSLDFGENGGLLALNPESKLQVFKLGLQKDGEEYVCDTKLEVRKGAIVYHVRNLAPASKYEIKAPKGVAGVRAGKPKGTAFRITTAGEFDCAYGNLFVLVPLGHTTLGAAQSLSVERPGGGLIRDLTQAEKRGLLTQVQKMQSLRPAQTNGQ